MTARARHILVTIASLLALCIGSFALSQPLSVPKLGGRVNDTAGVLSSADRQRLSDRLARYERETSHQVAILTVPTLAGESIETFSRRVANTWGLGRKGIDNGILLVLATGDRRVRIELGLGFEKYIRDQDAESIIAESMVPKFRKGDYAGGLQAGLEPLMSKARAFVVTPTTDRWR
jgi:uncharacterized protein